MPEITGETLGGRFLALLYDKMLPFPLCRNEPRSNSLSGHDVRSISAFPP